MEVFKANTLNINPFSQEEGFFVFNFLVRFINETKQVDIKIKLLNDNLIFKFYLKFGFYINE